MKMSGIEGKIVCVYVQEREWSGENERMRENAFKRKKKRVCVCDR